MNHVNSQRSSSSLFPESEYRYSRTAVLQGGEGLSFLYEYTMLEARCNVVASSVLEGGMYHYSESISQSNYSTMHLC